MTGVPHVPAPPPWQCPCRGGAGDIAGGGGGARGSALACDAKSMPPYFVPSLKRSRVQVGGGPPALLAHRWGWWHRGAGAPQPPPSIPCPCGAGGSSQGCGVPVGPEVLAAGDSVSPAGTAALAPDSRGGNAELINPALRRAPCRLCHRPS